MDPGAWHTGNSEWPFHCAMGTEGLYRLDMRASGGPRAWNERASGATLYYYSATYLGSVGRTDLVACSGRTDGLIRFQLDTIGPENRISTLSAPAADVIDVCSLESTDWPFAVAALRLDRSVILVRDLRSEIEPDTVKLEGISGTPYAIRCARSSLHTLRTNK